MAYGESLPQATLSTTLLELGVSLLPRLSLSRRRSLHRKTFLFNLHVRLNTLSTPTSLSWLMLSTDHEDSFYMSLEPFPCHQMNNSAEALGRAERQYYGPSCCHHHRRHCHIASSGETLRLGFLAIVSQQQPFSYRHDHWHRTTCSLQYRRRPKAKPNWQRMAVPFSMLARQRSISTTRVALSPGGSKRSKVTIKSDGEKATSQATQVERPLMLQVVGKAAISGTSSW